MDDELAKNPPKIQADNHSIAIGEINISGTVTGNITIGHTIVQPADARLRHELGILLKNVQTTWIKGVLEKSIHEAALLELGLELREEAVDNPWRMVIEGPDQTQQTLPRGRKIKDIFDEANRLLLILGEPGSGKTTTLLQLARDLIAEVDPSTFTQPVPVILNLSTWTNKAQPLDEWLVAELNSKYRLPKKDGQRWLKERRILPLLDGLDEVRVENRAACVEKINQLVTDYGLQGLVVCSRIKDYVALDVRLAFYRAIYIQPLTPEQVDDYLEKGGEKLASLWVTLQADEALRSMAQSPLILNIMSLSYQNVSANDLSNPSLSTDKARRQHLFDTYIARMFNRKVSARLYDDEQTKQRLSWLARNMRNHNQEIFLIEGLQPSWLPTRYWQWLYVCVSRLVIWLIFISRDIFGLLSFALSIGLPLAIIDIFRFEWLRKRKRWSNFRTSWWTVVNIIAVVLILGLCHGLSQLLMGLLSVGGEVVYGTTNWRTLLFDAISFGPVYGPFLGLRGSWQHLEKDIQTFEVLQYSWSKALRGGLISAICGFVFGVMLSLSVNSLIERLHYVLTFCMLFGLMGAIVSGLRPEIIETKSIPNQGIRLSIRNAILGGLISGMILGLSFVPIAKYWPIGPTSLGWIGGIAGVLWYGGLDVIQHYALRLILLIQGHTPANYARFLDYAVDRIFLQKVGGGYRFIHRLLLEHFAEMGEANHIPIAKD